MSEPDASPARRSETATPAAESIESAVSTDSGAGVAVLALSALAFGYAEYPADGRDRDSLLSRATEPRIRMV